MDKIRMTVKCCIQARDKGILFLRREYADYKKELIIQIQKSVRQTIKQSDVKVYAQQKWMLERKLSQYLKNLPLHPMPFHNQSVWIEETETDNFLVHFKNKQLPIGEYIVCNLMVPKKYQEKIKSACGKDNPILGQVELIEDNNYGRFNLHLVLRLPKPEPYIPKGWIGVDIGWNCLAVSALVTDEQVSDVTFHGKQFKTRIIQLKHLLREYQRSNRSWKKWKCRLQHVTKNATGMIAKEIVRKAKKHKAGIVLEDLNFRSHTKQWLIPRYKLKYAIETLCNRKGVPFELVNPRNTSITCNKCGVINKQSRNGKSFHCKKCGYTCNADYNASVNIAKKAVLSSAICSRLESKKLYASKMGETSDTQCRNKRSETFSDILFLQNRRRYPNKTMFLRNTSNKLEVVLESPFGVSKCRERASMQVLSPPDGLFFGSTLTRESPFLWRGGEPDGVALFAGYGELSV